MDSFKKAMGMSDSVKLTVGPKDQCLSRLRALPFYYAKVRGRDTMSLGNRCGFYSRRDVYRTSDLSCKGSIQVKSLHLMYKMNSAGNLF